MRRYSSRAAACSSGKPSKPRAWEKRTTVELEVFARRASSSAVWKAASSRWSTMYWATSFWEREHSSKRAWMYLDRLWWSLVPFAGGAGGRSVAVPARRFIGALFDAGAPQSSPAPAVWATRVVIQSGPRRVNRVGTDCERASGKAERTVKIAIVGAGISGLAAAHLLHREHEIVVYEANSYAGGHSNTIRVDTAHETHHVDTGFIVMNDRNYPNFTRLLARLGVPTQPTQMSFSVKAEEDDFEYAGTPRGLYCQPRNLVSPAFQRMILDLLRFNRELGHLLGSGHGDESLAAFLARHRFSRVFVERLIVPQVSAVWSADPASIAAFPVRFVAEFFANHGMLGFRNRPSWSTIVGGSARYVEALTAPFRERIRLATPVRQIVRGAEHVELTAAGCEPERFDQVVIATHSDQALALLADPSPAERELLGAIPYQPNEAVLHTD